MTPIKRCGYVDMKQLGDFRKSKTVQHTLDELEPFVRIASTRQRACGRVVERLPAIFAKVSLARAIRTVSFDRLTTTMDARQPCTESIVTDLFGNFVQF